jgi:hypothetical protein
LFVDIDLTALPLALYHVACIPEDTNLTIYLLLLPWRYSPGWAKASFFWDFIPNVSWSVSVHSVVSDRLTDRTLTVFAQS